MRSILTCNFSNVLSYATSTVTFKTHWWGHGVWHRASVGFTMRLWCGLNISYVAFFSYMAEPYYTNQTFLYLGHHNTICHYYIWSLPLFELTGQGYTVQQPTWTPLLFLLHLVTDISNIFSFALFRLQSSIHFYDWPTNKHRGNLFVRCLTVSHPIINVIFRRNICWYKLAADQSELFLTQNPSA